MARPSLITIDGPAASGKSTIGYLLANEIHYLYLDTGSMYRAVTLAVLKAGIDPQDEGSVTQLSRKIDIEIKPRIEESDGRQYSVFLNGSDVTWDIRSPDVDENVSLISSYSGVREEMVRRQREYGEKEHIIVVGRDIGTVVFPNAPLKLYITASPEERARRRWLDRQKQGHLTDYQAILDDVNRRDKFDSTREISPLKPADDAVIINNTGRSPKLILEDILKLINDKIAVDVQPNMSHR